MPRPLKKRQVGGPPKVAEIDPELVNALSLAGVQAPRIASLLGFSLRTLQRRFGGHMKRGDKMPPARVAALLQRLIALAEKAETPDHIPSLIAAIKLLAPLHLPELAQSWQPAKETDDDLPPVSPSIGYAPPPPGPT